MEETLAPRCVVCDESMDAEEWSERLRAHQPFTEWRRKVAERHGGGGAAYLPVCVRCKTNPDRAERFLNELGPEGVRRRLDAVVAQAEAEQT